MLLDKIMQAFEYLKNLPDLTDYLLSFSILLIFVFLSKFLAKIKIYILKFILQIKEGSLGCNIVNNLVGPFRFLVIVIGFYTSIYYLKFSGESLPYLKLNKSIIIIIFFWSIFSLLPLSFSRSQRIKELLGEQLVKWFLNFFKTIIFILASATILEIWGIKIITIIGGLGLFGIAIALGAQDLFKNLISGVLVLVEKSFKVGDWIIVEGLVEGHVENIGFRSTTIRKFDKSLSIIPNFQFAQKVVTNISKTTNRRIELKIGIEYSATSDQLIKIRDEIKSYIVNTSLFIISKTTPAFVNVLSLSPSSVDIEIKCYTKSSELHEWLDVRGQFLIKIKEIVEAHKVKFAFPSQSVYIEKIAKQSTE
jgi:MscS family membrane protein